MSDSNARPMNGWYFCLAVAAAFGLVAAVVAGFAFWDDVTSVRTVLTVLTSAATGFALGIIWLRPWRR